MEGAVRIQVGAHAIAFRPPSTLHLSFGGDVSLPEAEELAAFITRHIAELPRVLFIVELDRLGKLPAEARRVLVARRPRDERHGGRTYRLGFTGANLRTRVLMSLAVSITDLRHQDTLSSRFFSSADEALTWARTLQALR